MEMRQARRSQGPKSFVAACYSDEHSFIKLSTELAVEILSKLDQETLASLAATCPRMHLFIYDKMATLEESYTEIVPPKFTQKIIEYTFKEAKECTWENQENMDKYNKQKLLIKWAWRLKSIPVYMNTSLAILMWKGCPVFYPEGGCLELHNLRYALKVL